MHPRIPEVCDALLQPDGEPLLRLLAAIYRGDSFDALLQSTDPRILRLASSLQLVEQSDHSLELTDPGYLVGNVAKEFCNWLDSGRRMPPPRPPDDLLVGRDLLDLGCSFGRWLWEFQSVARSVVGVEMQPEYLELGRALAQRTGITPPKIHCGSAEELERFIAPSSLDFVFSRLMFNHVRIKSTLRKVAATLRKGGIFWLQVETLSLAINNFLRGERRLRSKLFAAFGVVNSLVCLATGRQLSLKAGGRMHSVHRPAYPTLGWWKSALSKIGLRDFQLIEHRERFMAFWARKA